VVLDPRIIAAGFVDFETDPHGIYRLMGLFAYGQASQYLKFGLAAEEDELRRQVGNGRSVARRRPGPPPSALREMATDRRNRLAERLPPNAPDDLVLICSPPILRGIEQEAERAAQLRHIEAPGFAAACRRLAAAITYGHPDGLPVSRFERMSDQLLAAAVPMGAVVVTEDTRIASDEYGITRRQAPETSTFVDVRRLWPFVTHEVERFPFDLRRDVPQDLLSAAFPVRPEIQSG